MWVIIYFFILKKNKKSQLLKKAKHTMSGTMSAVKIIKLEPGDDFALIKQEIDMLKVWLDIFLDYFLFKFEYKL